jgi:hypothetical protein
MQLSTTVRNAKLDAIETAIGASALLSMFSGSLPADCTQADPTGLILTMTLPASWMSDASGGVKSLAGVWSQAASGAGIVASFRIYDSTGVTCHAQGTCSLGGGGGDMILDNTNVAISQVVTVQTFTLTEANA